MIGTLLLVATVGAALSLYTLVIAAFVGVQGYRNGYAAGTRDAAMRQHPSNVRRFPAQRGGAA